MTSSTAMSSIVIAIRDRLGRWLERRGRGVVGRFRATPKIGAADESAGHLIGRTEEKFHVTRRMRRKNSRHPRTSQLSDGQGAKGYLSPLLGRSTKMRGSQFCV
jgi:hypothetical protein